MDVTLNRRSVTAVNLKAELQHYKDFVKRQAKNFHKIEHEVCVWYQIATVITQPPRKRKTYFSTFTLFMTEN